MPLPFVNQTEGDFELSIIRASRIVAASVVAGLLALVAAPTAQAVSLTDGTAVFFDSENESSAFKVVAGQIDGYHELIVNGVHLATFEVDLDAGPRGNELVVSITNQIGFQSQGDLDMDIWVSFYEWQQKRPDPNARVVILDGGGWVENANYYIADSRGLAATIALELPNYLAFGPEQETRTFRGILLGEGETLPVPVPAPASLALSLTALAGLVGLARRRRRSTA